MGWGEGEHIDIIVDALLCSSGSISLIGRRRRPLIAPIIREELRMHRFEGVERGAGPSGAVGKILICDHCEE